MQILKSSFVLQVGKKARSIGESIAQTENAQEDNQDVIDNAGKEQTKKLLEEILQVYADQLATWRENADCSKSAHQARALIQLVIDVRGASKEKLG